MTEQAWKYDPRDFHDPEHPNRKPIFVSESPMGTPLEEQSGIGTIRPLSEGWQNWGSELELRDMMNGVTDKQKAERAARWDAAFERMEAERNAASSHQAATAPDIAAQAHPAAGVEQPEAPQPPEPQQPLPPTAP